jgi:poly-gamma-glutamate synthesis protein (capsule biosynthesis protein)
MMKTVLGLGLLLAILLYAVFRGAAVPESVSYVGTPAEATSSAPARSGVLFVGDVMLGRYVETLMGQNGSGYPFDLVRPEFAKAKAVVANLEGPILKAHVATPAGVMKFSFAPETAGLLRTEEVGIVTLANNHTYDFGKAGYDETKGFLAEAEVLAAGHPFSYDPRYVLETVVDGIPLAIFSFNATNPNFDNAAAAATVNGYAPKRAGTLKVAAVHWGEEYKTSSNASQRALAHALVDAGADIVVGHHPHVTEEIEVYEGRPVFYSLGNFIFDQYFSVPVEQGLALKLTRDGAGSLAFDLMPVQSSQSQPRFMEGDEKATWLAELAARCPETVREQVAAGTLVIPAF